MNIYVFGNPLLKNDNLALKLIPKLEKDFPKIKFIHNDPNEEVAEENFIILDVAKGIKKVELIENLDNLELINSVSMHDFDLAFNLKLLKKINKINTIKILAIPTDYPLKKAYIEVKNMIKNIFDK